MNPRIKLPVELFSVSDPLVLKAVEQVKESDLFVRPMDKGNSFHWVFGHITATRYGLAQALGVKASVAWEKLFDYGVEVVDQKEYPSLGEIKTAFLDVSGKLKERFETVTDKDLEGEPPFPIPGLEKSLAGYLTFLSYHEGYHVGQLAYLLRLHGGDKLIG